MCGRRRKASANPLLIRHNNRQELTVAGELLALTDDALHEMRGNSDDPVGTIRVAAPQTLCTSLLMPQLLHFAASPPGVRAEVQEQTSQALLGGTVDLGVVHGWPAPDADLQSEVIAWDTPVLVTPSGHPRAHAGEIGPEAMAALPLVVTMPGCRGALCMPHQRDSQSMLPGSGHTHDPCNRSRICARLCSTSSCPSRNTGTRAPPAACSGVCWSRNT